MCGRFALKSPPSELITKFSLDECVDFPIRYNVPPGTDIPVIRLSPDGKRVVHLLRWGLVPHGTKNPSPGAKLTIARGESVAEKPSFRNAFKRRRCLIPVSGFYEWKTEGKIKQPYCFSLKSDEPMALGGLWESWTAPDGTILRTVCIVTTAANEVMAPIHERMPVIVSPGNWQDWLSAPVETIKGLLAPYRALDMQIWPVSRRVSRVSEEGAELLEVLVPEVG